MAKTSNVNVRIEPDLKVQAEAILNALGIPSSNAIAMFYKQIVLHRGIPFDVRLTPEMPVDISKLTREQLRDELDKGYQEALSGDTMKAAESFDAIRKDYGL